MSRLPQPGGQADPQGSEGRWRCGNCGASFDLESALVRLGEVEDFRLQTEADPLFRFHRDKAEAELRDPDSPLRALSPFSEDDEIQQALAAASSKGIVEAARSGARLQLYRSTDREAQPLLGIDPGFGPSLLGSELVFEPRPREDPISYTLRWLERIVEDANDLFAGQPHGTEGGLHASDLLTPGPRSHRPVPGPSAERCYRAVAHWRRIDGRRSARIVAEGVTVFDALAEIAERIEARLDPETESLELTLTWPAGPSAGAEERAR